MTHTSVPADEHIILASASPRRRELLSSIGLRFQVLPSTIPEETLDHELPQDQVSRLAVAKATEISGRVPGMWVLGADTIVVIDGRILGKPRDVQEAREMLAVLNDRTHEVYTGYALVRSDLAAPAVVRWVRSEVHIRGLTAEEIAGYVATGEPMDKAGAYAIQGIGSAIVERISGSYTNVVGLPLCEVTRDLKELGIFNFLAEQGSDDR
ncbi:MAG: Maf family protein [Thermodesulfobacteriota bacterium]